MQQLYSFILFAFVAGITPGPNNIMIMTSVLNHGIKASMPHFLGICFGFPLMFLTMGFGLGRVFELYPMIHVIIQVLGAGFLLYLAWKIANAAPEAAEGESSTPFTFVQAASFQWLNPKAWTMATAALATFSSLSSDLNTQILIMGLIFWLFTFPCAGFWMFFGLGLQRIISRPRQRIVFNWVMALLLVLSILPVLGVLFEKLF